jgi:hypothetical protein
MISGNHLLVQHALFNASVVVCSAYLTLSLSYRTGSYVDWVIHSKLAYTLAPESDSASSPSISGSNLRAASGASDSGTGGSIQIWRNNYLLVSVDNILTSYNQASPPYMKFGSYVESWKLASDTSSIGDNWASVTYRELRLGDQGSSYDQVYTGDGTPCGAPCDDLFSKGKKKLLSEMGIELLAIPLGVIILFSIMFYRAAMAQKLSSGPQKRKLRAASAAESGHTKNVLLDAAEGEPAAGGSKSVDRTGELSRQSEATTQSLLNSFRIWWAEYNNPHGGDGTDADDAESQESSALNNQVSTNIDQEVAHSQLWQASKYRRAFWYVFGYFFLLCAIVFAAILYGRPVAHTHGLLPWTRLQNWTAVQASLIVVSGVMMIVYFLPLAYLPHDFNAGRAFKNDPKFLRKIGEWLCLGHCVRAQPNSFVSNEFG